MGFQRQKHTPKQRLLILISGWALIVLGAIGGLIPILQGWIFGVAGLLILSREYEWAHNLLVWLQRKFPRFARVMERVKAESQKIVNRVMRRGGEAA
jgi:type IV secretory pathway TrbD component